MCVEGVTLSTDDISHLVDLFPDMAEIAVPTVWLATGNCLLQSITATLLLLPLMASKYGLARQRKH